MAFKDKVMYRFIAAAERTFGAALPIFSSSGCLSSGESLDKHLAVAVAACPEQREVQLEMLDKPTA